MENWSDCSGRARQDQTDVRSRRHVVAGHIPEDPSLPEHRTTLASAEGRIGTRLRSPSDKGTVGHFWMKMPGQSYVNVNNEGVARTVAELCAALRDVPLRLTG